MRMFLLLLVGSSVVAAATAMTPDTTSAGADLASGDRAPAFALQGSDGRTYRLEDFKGKQVVVLAWFAKAFSGA